MSLVQVAFFTFQALKGNSQFNPRVIVGDWPHSESRAKYLIIGTVLIAEKQILTEVWGQFYSLENCPQKQFFQKLERCEDITKDNYYLMAKERLDDKTFERWFQDRVKLWENLSKPNQFFIPVAIKNFNSDFIVQDGAHRLSIRSLQGQTFHELGICLWKFSPKN